MTPLVRAGYLAHSRTRVFRRRVEESAALIARHPDSAVSISWGKDSTVLLHLAATIRPHVAAVHARYRPEERLPDTDRVRDAVLASNPHLRYAEAACPGEWDMYERWGFFVEAMTPEQRAAVRWWKQQFLACLRTLREASGSAGVWLGLRAEESQARQRYARYRGPISEASDGSRIGCPLLTWTGRDIWAYLVAHELPWLRSYDVAADRTRARSDFVFATGGAEAIRRHGAWQEWRAAYPEQFRHWVETFPEMARWV
jgi:3'-phosphoadenosine 5'-phosphosulfate sulfotransferase (PAPS reductase)/FAD synthetase